MNVELSPKAAKYLSRLDGPLRERIGNAIWKLSFDPPQGDIKALTGRKDYRVRVGQYRILFSVLQDRIIVLDIGPRGQIYKRG